MKKLTSTLIATALVMLLASCNKALNEMGYNKIRVDNTIYPSAFYTPVHERRNLYCDAPHYFSSSAYMGEKNVLDYHYKYTSYRISIIENVLGKMNTKDFYKPAFDDEFLSLCAPEIKKAIQQYVANNKESKLGGWQILKPTQGIDSKKSNYTVKYLGNDWFEAIAANNSSVKIHIVGTGKNLHPVIVGIENNAQNINIDSKAKKISGSYTPLAYIKLDELSRDRQRRNQDLESIASYIYKTTKSRTAENGNIIRDSDIQAAAQAIDNNCKHFVEKFYSDLTGRKFNRTIFAYKYTDSFSHDVLEAIRSVHPTTKTTAGDWQVFLGDNKSESYTVSTDNNGWYTISDATHKPFLRLQIRMSRTHKDYLVTGIEEV